MDQRAPYKKGDNVRAISKGRYGWEQNNLTVGKVYVVETCDLEPYNGKWKWYLKLKGVTLGHFEESFVPACSLAAILWNVRSAKDGSV